MKKIYNILIILITSISVFAQSPNAGIVPSSVNDRSRIDPSEQLRKSVNPFEVLMTDANSKTMFWDTSHYKEILNLGKVDSIAKSGDTTKFYDRNNNLVGLVLSGGNVKPTKYISLIDTTCTSWNGGNAYMCQDGVGATLANIVINGNTYTLNQPLYDGSGNPLPNYTALHTAVQNAISGAGYSATVSGFDDGGCYEIDFSLTSGCSPLIIDFNWFDGTNNQTTQGSSTPNANITQVDINTLIDTAQANCPSLTVAKLDSCNVSYLYMFNCSTGQWETFKTTEIKTAGKTLFVDEVTGNDATAKKGCPTCTWESPLDASNSVQYTDGDVLQLEAGTYNVNSNMFLNDTSAFLNLKNGAILNSSIMGLIGSSSFTPVSSPVKKTIVSGNGELINNASWVAIKPFNKDGAVKVELDRYTGNQPLGQFNNKDVNIKIKEVVANTYCPLGFFGNQEYSKNNIEVDNMYLYTTNPSVFYQTGIVSIETNNVYGNGFQRNNNFNISINNLEINRKHGSALNSQAQNYPSELNYNNTYSLYVNNYYQYNKDSLTSLYNNLSAFPTRSIVSVNTSGNAVHVEDNNVYNVDIKNAITDYSILCLESATDYYRNNKYIFKGNYVVKKLESFLLLNVDSLVNSTIVIDGDFTNYSGYPLLKISGSNVYNSKIILKGNFTSTGKIIEVTGGSFDVNSSITLEGTFKTTSTTLPAIDINHNRLVLDKASIITGGGYSVDSSAPINIIVKPGTSSNVTTSASVTQLGSTILVNSNYNN